MTEPSAPAPLGIIGAGAVGLGLAAHLSKVNPVSVVARSNKLEQLKRSVPPEGVSYIPTPSSLPLRVHSLWICTKAFAAIEAVKSVEFLLSQQPPVVLLSNGLGVYQECAEIVGRRAPIVRALVNTGFLETLDAVVQSGPLKIALAAAPEHQSALEQIRAVLEGAGAQVILEANVATAEWRKTLLNAVTNPICTLVHAANSAVTEDAGLSMLAKEVLAEGRAVAAREGFQFLDLTEDSVFSLVRAVGANRNSQLIDMERGRKTEIDYILGRIVRLASSYGIPVPRCETLYVLCRALEHNNTLLLANPAATPKPSPL